MVEDLNLTLSFLQRKEPITYQIFIEPKGKHLIKNDKWKEDLLKELREKKQTFNIDSDKYLITGIPFYNHENEMINPLKNKVLTISL